MLAAVLVRLAEEDPTAINPVVPDEIGEIFWGAVAFFSLWILMRYWLLPPLMRIREQRRAKEIADLEAAEEARTAAVQVRRDYDATLAEARQRAAAVLEEARSAAEAERQAAVSAAETEAAARRQEAMAELEAARARAIAGMGDDVADLATTAASKVVEAPIDASAHRSTVDTYVEGNR
ncbi:MAG: F0F1 ATP synthase subunit B [Microthrixaceae bacterium]|nr:F0F1 ATP synthase subunit B [Microthrixaceae bacterium]MCB9387912.1 F0F1 ATP synthase subunit B [Microthrixaceae bacterium]MCO5321825.1 F0F1 ATP synthase subunit B [Microthrixaceae bacterium]